MGFMDTIERGLERAVNSAFARTFRSGVQPVEIAAALRRELDRAAVTIDRDRTLAPHIFTIKLAAKDLQRLQGMGSTLKTELAQVVLKHAHSQNYQLAGSAIISFMSANITPGTLEVQAQQPNVPVSWSAVLRLNGTAHQLRVGTTIIGRGSDSDIYIADSAASRKHLAITWDGKNATAQDLNSTNGSKINGQRFREAQLQPDTVIYIGQTPLQFEFAPTITGAPETGANFWGTNR